MPFDHYKITKISDATQSQSLEDTSKIPTDADVDSKAPAVAPNQENSAPSSRVSLTIRPRELSQNLVSLSTD